MQSTGQQYAVVTQPDSPTDFFYSKATCQDIERLPNFSINHLPDELLLMIFNSYRRSIGPSHYDSDSDRKRNHGWFKLEHVCRKMARYSIMFAS